MNYTQAFETGLYAFVVTAGFFAGVCAMVVAAGLVGAVMRLFGRKKDGGDE